MTKCRSSHGVTRKVTYESICQLKLTNITFLILEKQKQVGFCGLDGISPCGRKVRGKLVL